MKSSTVKKIMLLGGVFSSFFAQSQDCTGNIATNVYSYNGFINLYTVPPGATDLLIIASGAQGAGASTTIPPGFGAQTKGNFVVTPGDQLKILVGEQPSADNGGGGGSFVTDLNNNPLIIAGGGGGGAGLTDSLNKNGQSGTSGGAGAAGGGLGGTAGQGGTASGSSVFKSGAGGGLLTDGADGNVNNAGGQAFINGGAGGTSSFALGGFGGGGSGSGSFVGGAGGGYSGGGSGGNNPGSGNGGPGGGGGTFNAGYNQETNTFGIRTGHGLVQICANSSGTDLIFRNDFE